MDVRQKSLFILCLLVFFTSPSKETIAVSPVSTHSANGTTYVPTNMPISVKLTEPIDPTINFIVSPPVGGMIIQEEIMKGIEAMNTVQRKEEK